MAQMGNFTNLIRIRDLCVRISGSDPGRKPDPNPVLLKIGMGGMFRHINPMRNREKIWMLRASRLFCDSREFVNHPKVVDSIGFNGRS